MHCLHDTRFVEKRQDAAEICSGSNPADKRKTAPFRMLFLMVAEAGFFSPHKNPVFAGTPLDHIGRLPASAVQILQM